MQQEAVRMIADWFLDATSGVNVLLSVVPKEAGDTPPNVTVVDSTRNAWVSRIETLREKIVVGSPLLAVSLFDDVSCKNNPQLLIQAWQDADSVVSVRYITGNTDAAIAEREASYTMRCVRSSLLLLGQHTNLAASRTRNLVRIKRVEDIRVVPTMEVVQDVAIFGGLSVSLAMQDVIAT